MVETLSSGGNFKGLEGEGAWGGGRGDGWFNVLFISIIIMGSHIC